MSELSNLVAKAVAQRDLDAETRGWNAAIEAAAKLTRDREADRRKIATEENEDENDRDREVLLAQAFVLKNCAKAIEALARPNP